MVYPIFILFCMTADVYLQPYDAIEIKIWRQEELSGWYSIDDDTTVTVPLLGKFSLQGVTLDSLSRYLNDEFANYYTDIHVDINFYYRINIFGEVIRPGYYYVRSEDNLVNLLAQAGGPTNEGSLNNIRIINVGKERKIDLKEVVKSEKYLDKLALYPGDVVIVPRRFMPIFQEWSVLFTLGTLILQIYIAAQQ